MPATRPRASFEPIPPDFDINTLVEQTENFQFVDRISCDMIDEHGVDKFDKLVLLHVIVGGKPLVIDGYQTRLDPWTFSKRWLQDNYGDKVENARDLASQTNIALTVGHYLRSMGPLADQYYSRPAHYKDKNRQRVYLKDIDCPQVWQDKVKEQLPPNLFYLNDCTGAIGGPGSTDEPAPHGGKRKGRGIAPAGDLMSSLPPAMRAENLMCYIGHEGTYTPAHREMCASLGHNIMVECSEALGDDGKPEHPGSSIWFMTESKDRHSVAEYWLSKLGHDVEVEKHFAQVAAWKKAPFSVYVVDQRPGDFILIPPLAPHQVWNRGTRTMKVAWNRTTVETLELALHEALPNSRIVCRDEQYKNKAIIYYTLQKYSALLAKLQDLVQTAPQPQEVQILLKNSRIRALQKDFKRLFKMFKQILLSEAFKPDSEERGVQFMQYDSTVTCSYCRGNIFNRFMTCTSCEYYFDSTLSEPYDICMECYAMGRSCGCLSKLRWVEQFKWKELASKYEQFRKQYLQLEGPDKPDSPLPLQEERIRLDKKTLAQVCQEQLKRRPWKDVMNPAPEVESESEEETATNDDGSLKKKGKKRRSETWLKNHWACHVCCHRHEKWKMAECKCGRRYCYGTLFRAHDLMPQTVMEDPDWTCPHCKKCCSSGQCRKNPEQTPHEPKGTLLGHNTKAVADIRSVEILVDFSVSNLHFLNETSRAPASETRLIQRQQEADAAKANEFGQADPYESDDEIAMETHLVETEQINSPAVPTSNQWTAINTVIDPILLGDTEELHIATQAQENASSSRPINVDGSLENEDDLEMSSIIQNGPVFRMDVPHKRGAGAEDKSVSSATKQYRKKQARQALDTARKEGRWIIANGALTGKSRIVKLSIPSNVLRDLVIKNRAQLQAQAALGSINTGYTPLGPRNIIQSDIAPPKPPASEENLQKSSKQVRVRTEKDEDFSTRKRRRGGAKTGPGNTNGNFEHIDMSDDDDEHYADAANRNDAEIANRGKKRRISAWQAQHRGEEDEDGPVELPDNFKDSRRGLQNPNAVKTKPSFKPSVLESSPAADAEQAQEANAAPFSEVSQDAEAAGPDPDPDQLPTQVASKAPAPRPFTGGKSTGLRPAAPVSTRGTIEDASSDPSDTGDDSDIENGVTLATSTIGPTAVE